MNNKKCYHCGADYLLHQYETLRCPRDGKELSIEAWKRGKKQQWQETTFEEMSVRKKKDAAPKMFDALTGEDVPQLYRISWLQSLVKMCRKENVMVELIKNADGDGDAIETMLSEVEQIVIVGMEAVKEATAV